MLGRTWGALVLPDIQQRYPLSEIRFPVPLEPTNAAAGLVLEAPVIVCFAVLQNPLINSSVLRLTAPSEYRLGNVSRLAGSSPVAVAATAAGNVANVTILEPGLLAGPTYCLAIYVRNPPAIPISLRAWMMQSIGTDGTLVDEGFVEEYQLYPAAALAIVNLDQQPYSDRVVTARIAATMPAPVRFGDSLVVQAPDGFLLPGCPVEWLRFVSSAPEPSPRHSCDLL
ncbi:unnamed protein product [Symbiodinium natans]|uniref:Uncharacterized protein n=1 Tax=Symbiodinium natans TaxID=878477 RepID=A0A812QMZ6_9DINO|nr:unnamed protein product [Symbiodinium natans]